MAEAAALPDSAPAACERPRSGEIHLWDVNLASFHSPGIELLRPLSDEERGRAARLISAERRRWFVLSHLLLRRVLAGYVQIAPERLTFEAGPFGKPRLAGRQQASIDFNISHSGERLLIAITGGDPVGVDLEALRPVPDALAIARRHFAPAEYRGLADLAPGKREHAFLVCWTRKEAVMKAHGGGIGLGLTDIVTGSAPIGAAGLEVSAGGSSFWVRDIDVPGHVAAIGCENGIGEVVRRVLP